MIYHDSWKKPQKLQKEGLKEEAVSYSHISSSFITLYFSSHPFAKKEWYNVQVPTIFDKKQPTITPCNKTAGQSTFIMFIKFSFLEIAADSLKGRVFDISLADLNES